MAEAVRLQQESAFPPCKRAVTTRSLVGYFQAAIAALLAEEYPCPWAHEFVQRA